MSHWPYEVADPLKLAAELWPHERYYDKQVETIYSVEDNDETYVPAANMMGKDFIAARVVILAALRHPVCRIVTTSVKDDHLRVLWGEITNAIQSSAVPLTRDKGGPLLVNHRDIRKAVPDGKGGWRECKISYVRGMVSEKGEGMAGHHAPYTLFVGDEASGLDDVVYTQAGTWAKRMLLFGNCNPTANFFKKYIDAGDLVAS